MWPLDAPPLLPKALPLLLAAVGLAGCASPLDIGPRKDRFDASPPPARSPTGGTRGGGGSISDSTLEWSPDAGADEYVALALRRNPSIEAARHEVGRLRARVAQVSALDDPMLQVSPVGEMAETAAGQVELMAGVSQRLPFPGKRDARGRIAASVAAMAEADLAQTRLEVAMQTRRAYWSLYAAARGIEVTRESRGLLEQFRDIAEAKYSTGTAQQQEVLRASVELSNLDRELATLTQSRATAEAMLNRMVGRPVTMELPDPPAASPEAVADDLDALLVRAAASHPAMARLREQLEGDRERIRLARLSRLPDLTVGVQYNAVDSDGLAIRANGDDQWWLTFGINLPIWTDKYDAAQREAVQGRFKSLAELRAQGDEVAFEVRDAFERVRAQRRSVTLLRDRIVPEAERAARAALEQYAGGGGDALAVIDAWRQMLAFRQMLFTGEAMLEQAAADLTRAVGDANASPPSPLPMPAVDAADDHPILDEVQP